MERKGNGRVRRNWRTWAWAAAKAWAKGCVCWFAFLRIGQTVERLDTSSWCLFFFFTSSSWLPSRKYCSLLLWLSVLLVVGVHTRDSHTEGKQDSCRRDRHDRTTASLLPSCFNFASSRCNKSFCVRLVVLPCAVHDHLWHQNHLNKCWRTGRRKENKKNTRIGASIIQL